MAIRYHHTDLGWREWYFFEMGNLGHQNQNSIAGATGVGDYTSESITSGKTGQNFEAAPKHGWGVLIKILDPDFEADDNLKFPFSGGIYYTLNLLRNNTAGGTYAICQHYLMYDPLTGPAFDHKLGSSLYVDGIHGWPAFPINWAGRAHFLAGLANIEENTDSDLGWYFSDLDPSNRYAAYVASRWPLSPWNPVMQNTFEDFVKYGLFIYSHTYQKGGGATNINAGEYMEFYLIPYKFRIYYADCFVNSIDPGYYESDPSASGIDFELNGLGFLLPDASLNDFSSGAIAWSHRCDDIRFIGTKGQGTFTVPRGDFSIHTNERIVIPAANMPALPTGKYSIELQSYSTLSHPGDWTYAGFWRTDSDGKLRSGDQLFLYVGYTPDQGDEPPCPYLRFGTEYYAPIDVRSDDIFWDGRIIGLSSLTRAIDDETGLFNVSDVDVDLANNDLHLSDLLSYYIPKGDVASITYGKGHGHGTWHEECFDGIIDDYDLEGPVMRAYLLDKSQKYFRKQIPEHLITLDEFPDAPETSIGQSIPWLWGKHEFTAEPAAGAIEAFLVDPALHKYVAASHPLNSITAVYVDGQVANPATYAVVLGPNGRMYIQFNNSKGEAKITFDCEGAVFGMWNSPNGYIQNPAYIIGHFITYTLGIPFTSLNLDTFDEVAQIFEDGNWGEIGRVAITNQESADSILQKMLYSFGIKFWQARDGRFCIGRKDITDLSYSLTLLTQIHLSSPPKKKFGLGRAINSIKAIWDFYPAADHYNGAGEYKEDAAIAIFGAEMTQEEPWAFPWIDDEDFANQRMLEDILKTAYGRKETTFTIPLEFMDQIDLFDTFALQDPFADHETGPVPQSSLYYVTSLTYNWEQRTIDVTAIDFEWLIAQYPGWGESGSGSGA